jgi:hypothetical protein
VQLNTTRSADGIIPISRSASSTSSGLAGENDAVLVRSAHHGVDVRVVVPQQDGAERGWKSMNSLPSTSQMREPWAWS